MANRLNRPHTTQVHTLARTRRHAAIRIFGALCAVVVFAFPLSGCGQRGPSATELIVTGSTTILPIAEITGEMYHEANFDKRVLVSGLGSSAGIETVSNGSADVGTSSRDLKPSEEVLPFDRTAAVLPGTGQVRSVVANARSAVGYISLGFVTEEVKVVAIDGVIPSAESVLAGEYPVQRLLHFYTVGEPEGLARGYIEFVLSDAVQGTIVKDACFLPISGGAR